jgi:hypothetical protein
MTNEIFNCEFCGRDTRNRSRICRKCTGPKIPTVEEEENARRHDRWVEIGERTQVDDAVEDRIRDLTE